jgi:hypothetical protein
LPSNVTSFANPGLSPSSPWNYRLRVRFPNGDWLCSNIANATTEPAAGGLPPPWAHRDVGIVGLGGLGFVSASNGLYAISGSGADIGGTSDAFQFAYQSWKGDGYLTARLTQLGASGTGLDPWAKFGLMFRQSLDAGSPNAFVFFSGNNGPGFQGRTASNGGTSYVAGSPLALPWLKLTRTGNVFTGYLSTDGIAWTPVNSATIPMSDPILVGIAVTSHTNSNLATGTFDHLQIGPAQPSMLTLGSRQTNGGFGLSVQGQPGWKNRIEISPDLVHWTAWATQFNSSGSISISDDSASGVPRRFYRAVVLP